MPSISDRPDQRFDIYGPPHKGIRHAHAAMLTELGRADFAEPQAPLLERLRFHLRAVARHLEEENLFLHPLLEERSPGSTSRLVTQHEEHQAYFSRLETLMAAIETSDGPHRAVLGRDLFLTFTQLVGMDLGHMDEEEQATWPLLCAIMTDDEMKTIVGKILASYPEDQLSYFIGHMAAAITRRELAETVGGLKGGLPAAAFAKLFDEVVRPAIDDEAVASLGDMALLPD